jgi:hypothetical protein
MSGRHTKGPWRFDGPAFGFGALVEAGNGAFIFGIAAGDAAERRSEDECTANAALLAASPDLLEALERALPYVDDAANDCRDTPSEAGHILDAARAAIARAKGEA